MTGPAPSASAHTKVSADNLQLLARGDLESAIGFHVRLAWVAMEQRFSKVMAGTGVTPSLYAILVVIEHNPGCRISDLCRAVGISPTNIVPPIAALLSRGLIFRDFSVQDRRTKRLRLTAAGEAYVAELRQRHEAIASHFTAKLGPAGMSQLLGFLRLFSDESPAPPSA